MLYAQSTITVISGRTTKLKQQKVWKVNLSCEFQNTCPERLYTTNNNNTTTTQKQKYAQSEFEHKVIKPCVIVVIYNSSELLRELLLAIVVVVLPSWTLLPISYVQLYAAKCTPHGWHWREWPLFSLPGRMGSPAPSSEDLSPLFKGAWYRYTKSLSRLKIAST